MFPVEQLAGGLDVIAVVCGSLQKTLKRKSNKTVVASMAATLSGLFSNPQLAQVPGATAAILQTAAFLPNELMTQLSNQVRPKKEKERKKNNNKKWSIYEERNEFMCTASDYDMRPILGYYCARSSRTFTYRISLFVSLSFSPTSIIIIIIIICCGQVLPSLRNMPSGATRDKYEPLIQCLWSGGRVADLTDLITEWLQAAVDGIEAAPAPKRGSAGRGRARAEPGGNTHTCQHQKAV